MVRVESWGEVLRGVEYDLKGGNRKVVEVKWQEAKVSGKRRSHEVPGRHHRHHR